MMDEVTEEVEEIIQYFFLLKLKNLSMISRITMFIYFILALFKMVFSRCISLATEAAQGRTAGCAADTKKTTRSINTIEGITSD